LFATLGEAVAAKAKRINYYASLLFKHLHLYSFFSSHTTIPGINRSLATLGEVVAAKAKRKPSSESDSVLTTLLRDSIGGNCKTHAIACISPADKSYDRTVSVSF
jgi:hypothetical protein